MIVTSSGIVPASQKRKGYYSILFPTYPRTDKTTTWKVTADWIGESGIGLAYNPDEDILLKWREDWDIRGNRGIHSKYWRSVKILERMKHDSTP